MPVDVRMCIASEYRNGHWSGKRIVVSIDQDLRCPRHWLPGKECAMLEHLHCNDLRAELLRVAERCPRRWRAAVPMRIDCSKPIVPAKRGVYLE
jgi:hypothetical protein